MLFDENGEVQYPFVLYHYGTKGERLFDVLEKLFRFHRILTQRTCMCVL